MQVETAPDESKPLIGGSNNDNIYSSNGWSSSSSFLERTEQKCWNCRYQFLALVFVVIMTLLFFPPFGGGGGGGGSSSSTTTAGTTTASNYEMPMVPPQVMKQQVESDGTTARAMYRPFCLAAGSVTARILQTSMGSPSQQWAHIPCYSQPEKVRRWASNRNVLSDDINMYGSPDAIIKTQLSTKAFADRSPILGFGAAFTEAASLNYQSLSENGKQKLMELMYGKSGLGYSLGRVHINSCDFSVQSYSFDNTDGDFNLDDFDMDVTHDAKPDGMIDMIKRATTVFNEEWKSSDGVDGDFKMYASPWSPPAWMKAPFKDDDKPLATHADGMTGSAEPSCLREGTGAGSRYAKTWALYFSKFITAYRNKGVDLWAVTVQNEPEFPAPWEACSYTPAVEADFVGYHLGPQLEKDHPDVQIFMFDHNKDHMNKWAKVMLNETHNSSRYVTGTAYHWYAGGMDRLLDGAVGTSNMHRYQDTLEELNVDKSHIVLGSESCHCPYTGYAGGEIEVYWSRAERYAHTILADLTAGSNAWVEWNLILDSIGGPNHLGNLCDTTVLAVPHRAINGSGIPKIQKWEHTNASSRFGANHGDERTREELNALGFPAKHLDDGIAVQPMYYYMGHISRYVRPGSEAVMGLVDTGKDGLRPFRSQGQVVAGGGLNDLARVGIEVTAWPCEGSTRQQFEFTEKGHITVYGHDWLGNPTQSCLATTVDKNFNGITTTECKKTAGIFQMVSAGEGDDVEGYVKFVHTNLKSGKADHCLVIQPSNNNGGALGPRGGSQVTYGSCASPAALWKYSKTLGEITSDFLDGDEVCMTTGWPFLQIGAFATPNGESDSTIVLLNEAKDSANYVLYNGDVPVVSGSIPPRSIQTILLDSA